MEVSKLDIEKTIETSFQKRLKRQVVGRVRDYFAVTAPGLETFCLKELQELPLSVKDAQSISGGVRFKGRLVDCYIANLHLGTAGRVLMRIGGFKATGFSRLHRKLVQIPWELFILPGLLPAVKVSTRHCRLYHGGAIASQVLESINRRLLETHPLPAPVMEETARQQVFIRGTDDRFVVSMDSSGENLYKRGIKQQGGKAPLRETLAAAVLKSAGYSTGEPLIDPMCGTGTFSLEAAMLNLNIPAGWFRSFSFTSWPSFQPRRWDYLRRESQGKFVTTPESVVFASDHSRQACDRLSNIVQTCGFSRTVAVSNIDFFSFLPTDITNRPGLVVINPPYGRRLGSLPESRKTLERIVQHLGSAYHGWKFALIVPQMQTVQRTLKPCKTIRLLHGGLRLTLFTGKIG